MEFTKEDLKTVSGRLIPCPFCGGTAEFYLSKNANASLCIRHIPKSGIICPALYDQYCETFENGQRWWNQRTCNS